MNGHSNNEQEAEHERVQPALGAGAGGPEPGRMIITPDQVRGRSIRRIWVSPQKSFGGYSSVRTVVELQTGLRFELRSQDPDDRRPLEPFEGDLAGWKEAGMLPTHTTA